MSKHNHFLHVAHFTHIHFNHCRLAMCVCRRMILQYGLWDQVRVDQGTEWVLMLHVHEALAVHRNCTDKPAFVASSSKKVSMTINNLCNDVGMHVGKLQWS